MEYIKGFSVKPASITPSGVVLFTDGTTEDLVVNQPTCEAYGYTYNQETGQCIATTVNENLVLNISKSDNIIQGSNDIGRGTTNSLISGQNNKSFINRNCLVIGENHSLQNNFNNASVLGGMSADIRRQSEVAIGGGFIGQLDAGRSVTLSALKQQSFIQLSGVTTDNTATKLTVQGDGSSYINVRNNSILGYEIYLTRFELGGSSGTAGNYSFREIKGAVQIDDSYNMAFVVGFTRNIAKVGVNGSFSMVDSSTSDVKSITVEVTDRNNVNNLWSATVYLHEVVSTTTTF
tara:strand:+ start:645 stop:1517 length:873 start_codon:yes stop_codon:yes gene_type:complete